MHFAGKVLARCLAALADGIAVKFSTPALAIDTRRNVVVETPKGRDHGARRHCYRVDQRDCVRRREIQP